MKKFLSALLAILTCFTLVSIVPVKAEDANVEYDLSTLKMQQEENIINFEFNANSVDFDIERIELRYIGTNDPDSTFTITGDCALIEEKYKGNIDLNEYLHLYYNYQYGSYQLQTMTLYGQSSDEIANTSLVPTAFVELNADYNPLEELVKDNFVIATTFEDNKFYYRVGTGYTNCEASVETYNYNGKNLDIRVDGVTYDTTTVDFNTVGEYKMNVTFTVKINANDDGTEDFIFEIPVNVVEVEGEVLVTTLNWEHSCTIKQFEEYNTSHTDIANIKIPVKLNDGTIIMETYQVEYSGGAIDMRPNADGTVDVKLGQYIVYNPKYTSVTENMTPGMGGRAGGGMASMPDVQPGKIKLIKTFHIVNENGDLINQHGQVIVPFEERETITYDTSNKDVNISALFGTLPSYTQIQSEEVDNLEGLEDCVAYDINLEAAYGKNDANYNNLDIEYDYVQPVGSVDLTIDLPEDLQDGESYVAYHYDDEGNKEEVEVTVENGKAYIKADSFSTYAIVKKSTTTDGGNGGSTEDNTDNDSDSDSNAGNGGSVPGSGNNTNDSSSSNNNTTGNGTNDSSTNSNTTTSPNTGDSTNVAMLLALLLSSAYVLGRKRA